MPPNDYSPFKAVVPDSGIARAVRDPALDDPTIQAYIAQQKAAREPWSSYLGSMASNAYNAGMSLLPTALGGRGDTGISDIAKGAVESARSGFTLPGDALAGRIEVFDPVTGRPTDEAMRRGADFTGLLTLGAGAVPAEANTLRMGAKGLEGTETVAETKKLKRWAHDIHPALQDKEGLPKRLYHGTASDISVFKPSATGEFGPGIYATDLPDEASTYAGTHPGNQNVMPVYFNLKNPFVVKNDPQEFWSRFGGATDQDALFNAMAEGYDGVVYRRPYFLWDDKGQRFIDTGKYATHYVAFSPNQVKSAVGNSGEFDPRHKDITKAKGGIVTLTPEVFA